MLETIQQLEAELAEKITTAKHDAATAIQAARAAAADERAALEARLRTEEQQAIAAAEAKARAEADALVAAATATRPTVDNTRAAALAKELLAPFIS
jgi:vacuolar-type H+-ATPase subunit H